MGKFWQNVSNVFRALGSSGGFWNALLTGIGTAYEIRRDQSLTGAQREANAFSSSEAETARNFEAAQAEIARQWEEEQYLKYNSPAAVMRQYQDAGLNPSLLYGSAPSGSSASMSTSIPSSSAPGAAVASSVFLFPLIL